MKGAVAVRAADADESTLRENAGVRESGGCTDTCRERQRESGREHDADVEVHKYCRWRPYRVECTGSLPNSEVKRRRARLVLGWGTAREDLRVPPAFRLWDTASSREHLLKVRPC